MGSIKRTSAAGWRLASVALTLGMLRYSLKRPEADCESVNALTASNAEEYQREQKQGQTPVTNGCSWGFIAGTDMNVYQIKPMENFSSILASQNTSGPAD